MKEAPFYIGQKVVCLKKSKNGDVDKGDIVTVSSMVKCKCGEWMVGVAEAPGYAYESNHMGHSFKHKNTDLHGGAKYFAPIEDNHYEDVTKELAKLPQDEIPDVKKVKELVN